MPELDLVKTPTAEEAMEKIPEGLYKVMVDACKQNYGKKEPHNEFYSLSLKVMEGEYRDKTINDSLFFTEKALPRVKSALSAMGIDVTKKLNLEPEMLVGCTCQVDVKHRTYKDNSGKEQTAANVSYDGYRPWNPPAGVIPPKTDEPEIMDFSEESMEDAPF